MWPFRRRDKERDKNQWWLKPEIASQLPLIDGYLSMKYKEGVPDENTIRKDVERFVSELKKQRQQTSDS